MKLFDFVRKKYDIRWNGGVRKIRTKQLQPSGLYQNKTSVKADKFISKWMAWTFSTGPRAGIDFHRLDSKKVAIEAEHSPGIDLFGHSQFIA